MVCPRFHVSEIGHSLHAICEWMPGAIYFLRTSGKILALAGILVVGFGLTGFVGRFLGAHKTNLLMARDPLAKQIAVVYRDPRTAVLSEYPCQTATNALVHNAKRRQGEPRWLEMPPA